LENDITIGNHFRKSQSGAVSADTMLNALSAGSVLCHGKTRLTSVSYSGRCVVLIVMRRHAS